VVPLDCVVPLDLLTPRYDLPIVPVTINGQGPPLARLHRAWAFGEAIRRAANSIDASVAVVGTGGISHWPDSEAGFLVIASWPFCSDLGSDAMQQSCDRSDNDPRSHVRRKSVQITWVAGEDDCPGTGRDKGDVSIHDVRSGARSGWMNCVASRLSSLRSRIARSVRVDESIPESLRRTPQPVKARDSKAPVLNSRRRK
jgi:hypothetical protein